jgi:hypothetical protein
MNEIKTENPRIINEHQWRTINRLALDNFKWGYTATIDANLKKRYNFWLEPGHLSPELIHLMMKSDGGPETILQVLTLGNELSSIAKQMLAIGWQLWMDENNRLI